MAKRRFQAAHRARAAWMACLLGLAAVTAALAAPRPAMAQDGRFSVLEENDSIFFNSDRYYTQGLQLNYLGPTVAPTSGANAPFDFLGNNLGVFSSDAKASRHYEVLFGQQIYTPANIHTSHPNPDDRPYAGWLYGGLGLIQDTDHRQLDHLEVQLGVVGPASAARTAQNDWHQFIGVLPADGWDSQLHNEPGIMISYEHKWRFLQPLGDGFAVDAIPELGATVGNVMTYAEGGTFLRIGRNLEADYGPARMRPTLSGTSYFDESALDGPFGFYFYVGAQGRAVARNIFLDGNSFQDSASVDRNIFVGDLVGGLSLFWSNAVKLDTNVIYRTKEYSGQDQNEKYAGINLSFGL
jgi:hypothetical protein